MFSNGCYANQFTREGISERILLSPDGGAIAFLHADTENPLDVWMQEPRPDDARGDVGVPSLETA